MNDKDNLLEILRNNGDLNDVKPKSNTQLTELQLAEWLTELKEAKRLLKAAVEDIHELLCDRKNIDGIGQSCNVCSYIDNCPCCNRCDIIPELRTWRYADEAENLLSDEK